MGLGFVLLSQTFKAPDIAGGMNHGSYAKTMARKDRIEPAR